MDIIIIIINTITIIIIFIKILFHLIEEAFLDLFFHWSNSLQVLSNFHWHLNLGWFENFFILESWNFKILLISFSYWCHWIWYICQWGSLNQLIAVWMLERMQWSSFKFSNVCFAEYTLRFDCVAVKVSEICLGVVLWFIIIIIISNLDISTGSLGWEEAFDQGSYVVWIGGNTSDLRCLRVVDLCQKSRLDCLWLNVEILLKKYEVIVQCW